MNKVKVLIADSHYLFCHGVECILSEDPSVTSAGKAQNGKEAIEMAKLHHPDIILLDVNLPGINGLAVLKMILKTMPEIKVLMFSTYEEEEQMFEAMKSGAKGYLLKNILPNELLAFIHMAHRGESVISGPVAEKVMTCFTERLMVKKNGIEQLKQTDHLTKREKEILMQVVKGMTNKEIANVLFISENTVKNHLRNIMEKLKMNNRVKAATYALQEGWLKVEELQSTQ